MPAAAEFRDLDAHRREAALDLDALAAFLEPLDRVLPEERVEAEARLLPAGSAGLIARSRCGRGSCRRGTRGRREVQAQAPVRVGDGIGGFGGPAVGEDAETGEQPALLFGQEVVAPGDRSAQGPLALGEVARTARQVQAPAEALQDQRRTEEPDPCRGKFDGERQPAQAIADAADRCERLIGEREVRPVCPCAVQEQGHAGLRVEGRDGVPTLAADPQELAARRDDPQVRGGPDQPRHDLGAASGRSCSRLSSTRSAVRSRRCAPRASWIVRSGDSRTSMVAAIAGSRSAGSRTAARSTNQTPCGNRTLTSRATPSASRVLPLPPGPVSGHDPVLGQRLADQVDLGLPADEGRDLARQVRGRLRGSERPRIVRGARNDEAMQAGGLIEVLDRAKALVDETRAIEPGNLAPSMSAIAAGAPDAAGASGGLDEGIGEDRPGRRSRRPRSLPRS